MLNLDFMKTIFTFLLFLSVSGCHAQKVTASIDDARRFFIQSVLPKQVNKGYKLVVAPMSAAELIPNIAYRSGTLFSDRLSSKDYYDSQDSVVINGELRNVPKFELPKGDNGDFLIFLDRPSTSVEEIQALKLKNNASYATVSGFVFSKDFRKCLVFVHISQGGGASFELVRNTNGWALLSAKQEWIE